MSTAMTDRELSEKLQKIDEHEAITLNQWEADFMESFQRVRRVAGTSKHWWTEPRRAKAAQIIEKFEAILDTQ